MSTTEIDLTRKADAPGFVGPRFAEARAATLLELLITMVVIGVTAVALGRAADGYSDRRAARADVQSIITALRQAHAAAVNTGVLQTVRLTGSGMLDSGGIVKRLSGLTRIDISGSLNSKDRFGEITFFGDGSSTGGKFEIESSGRLDSVSVNWITGYVEVN